MKNLLERMTPMNTMIDHDRTPVTLPTMGWPQVMALVLPLGWMMMGVAWAETGIQSVPAMQRTTQRQLLEDGVVEAVNQATMTSQSSGQIIELKFDVNDYVEKGQLLLRIKGEKGEAGLAMAKASVQEAMAAQAQAKSEHDRMKTLFDKKMVTASQMDQARASFQATNARVAAANAQVASASDTVSDAVIHAPYSGYVLKRFIQLGETAQVGQPLFSGMSLDALRVLVYVPQSSVDAVRQYAKARIIPDHGSPIPIEKMTIFPYADEKDHAFGIRLTLPNGLKDFYPGSLVRVAFQIGNREQLLIPKESLVQRSELAAVYVINKQNQATLRRVLPGEATEDGYVEILSGLGVGEQVALDPVKAGQTLHTSQAGH